MGIGEGVAKEEPGIGIGFEEEGIKLDFTFSVEEEAVFSLAG